MGLNYAYAGHGLYFDGHILHTIQATYAVLFAFEINLLFNNCVSIIIYMHIYYVRAYICCPKCICSLFAPSK